MANCVWHDAESHSSQAEFTFDLNAIGDTLIVEHNLIGDSNTSRKGLHLSFCNGGTVNANVLNSDTLIDNCKAITFMSNHI